MKSLLSKLLVASALIAGTFGIANANPVVHFDLGIGVPFHHYGPYADCRLYDNFGNCIEYYGVPPYFGPGYHYYHGYNHGYNHFHNNVIIHHHH